MIASDLAIALDPVLLAERVGIHPDPWQVELLRCEDPRVVLNIARQAGKSTTTSIIALHEVLFRARALVLVVCPALRQAKEFFAKLRDAYHCLPPELRVPLAIDQALEWRFANGSRVVCIPDLEATVRGFSAVTLIVADEASRIDDALYVAVTPMLAVSGGRLILLSTPAGKRGRFFEVWGDHEGDEWREVRDGWRRFRVTAEECPRYSPEFLAHERATMPAPLYEQEYECRFREVEGAVFGYADVMGALDSGIAPLFGGLAHLAPEPPSYTAVDESIRPLFGGAS